MSDELTDAEVSEIDERCDAATPLPWEECMSQDNEKKLRNGISIFRDACEHLIEAESNDIQDSVDMEFIAHARKDVPKLVDTIRSLRTQLAESEKRVAELKKAWEECSQTKGLKYWEDSPRKLRIAIEEIISNEMP